MTRKMQTKRVEIPEASLGGGGRNPRDIRESASNVTAARGTPSQESKQLIEAVVERENMTRALKRVERNKGAAGVDKMPVSELRSYLKEHWPKVKEDLLAGRYQPQPVRRVEIPKPGGKGMRQLGIPTVLDRLIQQALQQVISPMVEPGFSEHSYGFRPGRNAHMAVRRARAYVANGKRWVVDMDLEKFFDHVNHDVLMSRVARHVADKRVLRLIRRYLQAGALEHGLTTVSEKGTPQGGPISPLLSNILLDDLDKELERRGHGFCRYADDVNIYVASQRSGKRVLQSITSFLERKLKLRVNCEKSAVDRPWKRKFLGYSMTFHWEPKLKAALQSVRRLRANIRILFRAGKGRNLGRFIREDLNPLLRGWMNYFRLSDVKGTFEELDGWIRRRLRCVLWRQWKRHGTRRQRLMARGLSADRARRSATNGRGPWWNAGASHMNAAFPKKYFDKLGLVSLLDEVLRFQQV